MKNLNRWVYAIIGVITLLLAGLVYAWSVMSKSIGASRPDWTAAQLSMTFTMVMAFFCIGCLIAGMMAKKVSPKIYIILSGILFLAGFMLASTTGASTATISRVNRSLSYDGSGGYNIVFDRLDKKEDK